MHSMFYSSEAKQLRLFLRDKLGLAATDVGGGWLIFDLPEADLGCHPTDDAGGPASGTCDVSFYTDDIEVTMRELESRGVEFTSPAEDHGYGLVTHFLAPGGLKIQLYQPLYSKVAPVPVAMEPPQEDSAQTEGKHEQIGKIVWQDLTVPNQD